MALDTSLRLQTSRYYLLLLTSSVFILGLWSSVSSWYGGQQAGYGWVRGSPFIFKKITKYIEEHLENHARLMVQENHYFKKDLDSDEGLVTHYRNGKVEIELGSSISFSKPDLKELIGNPATGFHPIQNKLLFAKTIQLPADAPINKITLFRMVNRAFLLEVSRLINNEVIAVRSGALVASSIGDTHFQDTEVAISPELLTALDRSTDNEPVYAKTIVRAKNFSGWYLTESNRFEEGTNQFESFYCGSPLRGPNGELLGHIIFLVPVRVLLHGLNKGILGGFMILLIVTLTGFFIVNRFSSSIFNPLSEVTQKILKLSNKIQQTQPSSPDPMVPNKNEIGILENSLITLNNAVDNFLSQKGELERHRGHLAELVDERTRDLLDAKNESEKANASKSIFLANMSHELRTPLHGIMSFARFGLQKIETAPKEKLKTYFDEIYESASRLMNLLNDILDLSKLEAGKIVYSMKQSNFIDTVHSVFSEMEALSREKGAKFELESSENEMSVIFDNERIMQVLRNIISNAIKFSHPGTPIRVLCKTDGDRMSCQIINSGVGIPESELEAVFDKFIQSSKTRTSAGGTGLGLAICKEIIQQHNGKIWAESQLDGETKFTFEIPKKFEKEKLYAA